MGKTRSVIDDAVKYTEIFFNIEDVTFSIHYTYNLRRYNESESASLGVYPKNTRSDNTNSLHKHMYWELFINPVRPLSVLFECGAVSLSTDDILLISPGTMHTARQHSKSSATSILFSFERNRLYKRSGLYDQMMRLADTPYIHLKKSGIKSDTVLLFFDGLDSGNLILAARYFFDIISDILTSSVSVPRANLGEMLPDTDIRRNRRILRLIEKYYKEDISLETMAEELNLSVRQTSRIIRSTTGHTLGELITERRMSEAKNLLRENGLTVSEISARVGYSSPSCFYAAFKKYYGVLPKEYRNINNEKECEQ